MYLQPTEYYIYDGTFEGLLTAFDQALQTGAELEGIATAEVAKPGLFAEVVPIESDPDVAHALIEDQSKQTLMPVIRTLTNQIMGQVMEQGIPHAMYILSGIPLMVTTVLGLKYFINGDFASGMKL